MTGIFAGADQFVALYHGATPIIRVYGGASVVAAFPAAPTIVDFDSIGITPGADPLLLPTSGISGSWSAGIRSHLVLSVDASATISAVGGDTNDTAALIDSLVGSGPDIYDYLMTVVGGAVDANWGFDMSASVRGVVAALLFSADCVGETAYGDASGTGGPFTAPAIAVTGGPRNVRAIQMISVQGSHVTNPPTAPSGWSLVLARAATSNDPTLDSRSTLAIAEKEFLAGDLSWTGDAATIAATAWGGLSDAGAEPWRALSYGALS